VSPPPPSAPGGVRERAALRHGRPGRARAARRAPGLPVALPAALNCFLPRFLPRFLWRFLRRCSSRRKPSQEAPRNRRPPAKSPPHRKIAFWALRSALLSYDRLSG
jgi:hypothetical protein